MWIIPRQMKCRPGSLVFATLMCILVSGCDEEGVEQAPKLRGGIDHDYGRGCDEKKTFGAFRISTFLDSGGGRTAAVDYAIERHQTSPVYVGPSLDGPTIEIHNSFNLDPGYLPQRTVRLWNFHRLFNVDITDELPFQIRSMSLECGRDVTLIGNTRHPFNLNQPFTSGSNLRMPDCIDALQRTGKFKLHFGEKQRGGRFVRVEGRATFASAMREANRMLSNGMKRAARGQCRLPPPYGPIT